MEYSFINSFTRRTLEHNSVCAGGGAVEAALSVYLDDFARTLVSHPVFHAVTPQGCVYYLKMCKLCILHFIWYIFRVHENN